MSNFLLDKIIHYTKDKKSINYWKKAISMLGEGIVAEELGELKYQLHLGKVKNPAKYLTTLLQKRIQEIVTIPTTTKTKIEKLDSYLSPTQLELFKELEPKKIKENQLKEDKQMPIPYSKKYIPWATFVGPDFFTLSTNRAKSDKVLAKFRALDGTVSMIPLIRGKFFPSDKERGILTTDHGKILGGLDNIWNGQFSQFDNGAIHCYCDVKIRELAKLLGLKKFGGSNLIRLKQKLADIGVMPYYLDLSANDELRLAGFKGYGFTFLSGVEFVNKEKKKTDETIVRVTFSDPYSRQLLARRAVCKTKQLISKGSGITFLLRLYLESILIKNGGHSIGLLHLIEILNLPDARWHHHKFKRKEQFEKATKQLNGQKVLDGRTISVSIEPGLMDYMLEAKLNYKTN